MLTKLTLKNFKNFQHAELALGPLTVIIGANATGKSNLRDAFRFLHGISRGYLLADVFGEKRGEGGELLWSGIRGGTREVCYPDSESFVLGLHIDATNPGTKELDHDLSYEIEVAPGDTKHPPQVIKESLQGFLKIRTRKATEKGKLKVAFPPANNGKATPPYRVYDNNKSIVTQLANDREIDGQVRSEAILSLQDIGSCRFFEFSPDEMRKPSLPGQDVLGDRGENLSSVLQSICRVQRSKETLLGWLRQLTPMDVVNLDFDPDARNRVLLILEEQGGRRISADSASDGTLRFLAMLAAMFGPKRARFNFFEEIENGIHPTRLHLVTHFLEKFTGPAGVQVVATTHSPTVLHDLSPQTREHVAVTYRNPESDSASIRRMLDIADAATLLKKRDVAQFHSQGWFEDALYFTSAEGNGS